MRQQRARITTSAPTSAPTHQPAAFLRGAYDMAIGDHRIPELPTAAAIAAGEAEPSVIVDVDVVGICGSDMHYYKDGGIGTAKIGGPAFVSNLVSRTRHR